MKEIFSQETIKNFGIIVVGNVILSFSVAYFIIPNNVLTGGLAGIAIILKPFIPVSTSTIINFLVVALFILGSASLGKKFAMQTLLSSIIYPISLSLFTNFVPIIPVTTIYASIYGGLLAGVGVGMVMRSGASTGGMDIPPLVIHKHTGISIAVLVGITDLLTVVGGLFVYGLEAVLIGLFSVFCTSMAISKTLTFGASSLKSVQIISDKYQEINDDILKEMDRGTTILNGSGGYSNQERKVLLVVISMEQYNKLISIVNKYDDKAFIIVTDVKAVHGEGFSFGFKV